MARVQQRDQEAFTRLLDRHLAGLQRFLHPFTGNPADADELTQEAMLRIWSHARRWQPDRVKFSTWLYRIARNLAIDRHRQHRDTNDEHLEPIVDNAPDPFTRSTKRRRKMMQIAVAAAAGTPADRVGVVSLRRFFESGRGCRARRQRRRARVAARARTPNTEERVATFARTQRDAAMHNTPMTLDEFEKHLDLHGAVSNVGRRSGRAGQGACIDDSARAVHAQSRALGTLLDDAMPAPR